MSPSYRKRLKPPDTMTIEEYREYQRDGRLPDRLSGRVSGTAAISPNTAQTATTRPDSEEQLQRQVEAWLACNGYARFTAKNMTPNFNGWFGHWPKCKGNPFMPDLMIVAYPNTKPPLFMEGKVRDVWQPGQKDACTIGLWKPFWSLAQAIEIIEEWEKMP